MRSPSGSHHGGMRGRVPVDTSTASARSSSITRPAVSTTTSRGPVEVGGARAASARPGWPAARERVLVQAAVDALDPILQRGRGRPRCASAPGPCPPRRRAKRHGAAGGDHRLGRDAVPEVGGAAHDVALDQGDLGAEPGRVGGGGVAGRAAADDHEVQRHRCERLLPARPCPVLTSRSALGVGISEAGLGEEEVAAVGLGGSVGDQGRQAIEPCGIDCVAPGTFGQ